MKKYFDYLDELRDSGKTNMFGAIPYLQERFLELRYDRKRAGDVLLAWMDSYQERQGEDGC